MVSVLLIDDDGVMARMLRVYLDEVFGSSAALFAVTTLASGLRLLMKRRFDYILLDNRLPPFDDYRQTLPIVRLCARGTEPILVTVSPMDRCFAEPPSYGSPQVIDKFQLRQQIHAGLLNRSA